MDPGACRISWLCVYCGGGTAGNQGIAGETGVTKRQLFAILALHGVEPESVPSENLAWFGAYLANLKKILRESNHSVTTDEEREKKLLLVNDLSMPLRKVNGEYQSCLTLVPPSDVPKLEEPPPSLSPIRSLKYFTIDDDFLEIESAKGMMEGHKGRTLELDMFAGRQTWGERDESFQVKEEMETHCGFSGAKTGFDISPEDSKYMNECWLVVVTCTFGGGDDLWQPIGMTNVSLDKTCYVAFWDDVTAASMAEEGVIPDPRMRTVGLWRIVVVKNLPFEDQRRNGKIPKMLGHRLFPKARYSIWVDAKSQFRRDPISVLEALLWRPQVALAISEHGARSCIYQEGEAIVAKRKALPEEVAVQLQRYRSEGLPVNATFDGRRVLAEASVIVREHTTLTNLFMCLWFNENVRFSARDQLSFGYVLRRLRLLRLHMFPVCTRRALVNAIGHRRKPKPLKTQFPTTGNGTR